MATQETRVEPKLADPQTPAPQAPVGSAAPAPVLPLPAASAAPKAADSEAEPSTDPRWLATQLEQAKRQWLKELGAESPEEIRRQLTEAKSRDDATKSEVQKLTERVSKIGDLEKQRDALAETLGAFAKDQMKTLTPEQRSAVKVIAGDDPSKQIETIRALGPTWTSAAPKPQEGAPAAPDDRKRDDHGRFEAEAPAAPQKRVVPPLANSVPAPGAPQSAAPPAQPDHLAMYESLREFNPIRASSYYVAHTREIEAAKAAKKAA